MVHILRTDIKTEKVKSPSVLNFHFGTEELIPQSLVNGVVGGGLGWQLYAEMSAYTCWKFSICMLRFQHINADISA